MHAAQITAIVLLTIDTTYKVVMHGKERPAFSGWAALLDAAGWVAILNWGGFFA
jgi:hypothetical protein